MKGKGRYRAAIASLAAAAILFALASLAWNPVHRPSLRISDPLEDDIPPDYDAILLQGRVDGDTLTISLTVDGVIRSGRYIVNVVGKYPGPQERQHIYKLDYTQGVEESYGVPATRKADVLTFQFPISLLLDGALVVGLEGVVFTPLGPVDFVREGPREDLVITSLLALPFDPGVLFGTGVGLAVAGVLALTRFLTWDRT